MTNWTGSNFGVAVKAIAAAVEPGRPALIHGDQIVSWQELDRQSDAVAAGLLADGMRPGDVAGHQLRNSPDYMIAFFGCVKAGVVPINVNYHYRDAELADILGRFGIRTIFQDAEFADSLRGAQARGAVVDRLWTVGAGGDFAALKESDETVVPNHDPAGCFYVATGGTTGMPKAVMWRQVDAWTAFQISHWPATSKTEAVAAHSLAEHVVLAAGAPPPSLVTRSPTLMLSPLMHGAGLFAALITLLHGGTLLTMPGTRFDADIAIDTITAREVVALSFVGDAFGLPLVEALERRGAPEEIVSLRSIVSSGAVFSAEVKQRLLAINPGLLLIDALGSSESGATAVSVTTASGNSGSGGFGAMPGREIKIFDENFEEVAPGELGILARSGPLPLGYLGEDLLNARIFPTIDGVRYLMTGDRARIDADGKVEFAGRDNLCINTGGEKVFPEEVEAVLQRHPAVRDVRVVSLPDPRFGRKIVAIVNADSVDEADLDRHARAELASYKVPRRYFFTNRSLRLNNGKPDYKTAQAIADAG